MAAGQAGSGCPLGSCGRSHSSFPRMPAYDRAAYGDEARHLCGATHEPCASPHDCGHRRGCQHRLRVRAASPRGATASFVTGAPRVADGGARIVDVRRSRSNTPDASGCAPRVRSARDGSVRGVNGLAGYVGFVLSVFVRSFARCRTFVRSLYSAPSSRGLRPPPPFTTSSRAPPASPPPPCPAASTARAPAPRSAARSPSSAVRATDTASRASPASS